MGRRSLPVDVQCKSGLQMACNLDQSAMALAEWRNLRGFGGWELVL